MTDRPFGDDFVWTTVEFEITRPDGIQMRLHGWCVHAEVQDNNWTFSGIHPFSLWSASTGHTPRQPPPPGTLRA